MYTLALHVRHPDHPDTLQLELSMPPQRHQPLACLAPIAPPHVIVCPHSKKMTDEWGTFQHHVCHGRVNAVPAIHPDPRRLVLGAVLHTPHCAEQVNKKKNGDTSTQHHQKKNISKTTSSAQPHPPHSPPSQRQPQRKRTCK
jgi:hypothetical protein